MDLLTFSGKCPRRVYVSLHTMIMMIDSLPTYPFICLFFIFFFKSKLIKPLKGD